MFLKRMQLAIILLASVAIGFGEEPSTTSTHTIRILLVGDSTVNAGNGWGPGFAARMDEHVEVFNAARNGRSSKSYRDEKLWDEAIKHKADYMLIQFGHNDEPGKGPERETDPKTTYTENMKRYVTESRGAGFTPILVTSLTRRVFDKNGKLKPSLVPYCDAVRDIAKEMNVPLIDLNKSSSELCQNLGEKGCDEISPPDKKTGGIDHTHLNEKGCAVIGSLVADELGKVVPELATYIKAAAPTTQP